MAKIYSQDAASLCTIKIKHRSLRCCSGLQKGKELLYVFIDTDMGSEVGPCPQAQSNAIHIWVHFPEPEERLSLFLHDMAKMRRSRVL